MAHFLCKQWPDFVRGLTPHLSQAMLTHVEACRACSEALRSFQRLAVLASADSRYDPPPSAVRYAAASFAIARPQCARSMPTVFGRVVFDSIDQSHVAGVRGAEPITRRAVFEAGRFTVDVTLERDPASATTTLVGQAVDRGTHGPIAIAPVFLTAGRIVLATTISTEFGEFVLDYSRRGAAQLRIRVDDGGRQLALDIVDDRANDAHRARRISRHATRQRH